MSESQPTKETTVGETLRVTGKIKSAGWGDTSFVQIEVDQKLPLTIGVGQPVTLEITLPDPPLTVTDIHRAAIIERHRDDCRPEMVFSADCVDGVRRYAATYELACRAFDDAVRRALSKRGGGA